MKSTWSLSLSGRFMGAGHRGVDVLICHIFHCGSIHPRSFFRVAEYRKVFPYLRISLTPIYAMLFGCSCVRLTICLITQEILCASQAHKCVTWLLGVPWREWNSKSIETSIGLNNCILLLSGNVDIPWLANDYCKRDMVLSDCVIRNYLIRPLLGSFDYAWLQSAHRTPK